MGLTEVDFAFVTWWPLIFYPVTDAPNYRKGYIASLVTGALILPLVLVIAWLEKKGVQKGTLGRRGVEGLGESDGEDEHEGVVAGIDGPGKL